MKITKVLLLCALMPISNLKVWAATEQIKSNIEISGTVVATGNCSFSSPGAQDVDLGQLIFSLQTDAGGSKGYVLLGQNRASLKNLDIQCSGDSAGQTKMRLAGSAGSVPSSSGRKLVKLTNDSDGSVNKAIAVGFLVDGIEQDADTWFDMDIRSVPRIEAEAVQTADTGNDFISNASLSTSVTLTMEFY
jgi:hypothetical protein